MEIDYNPTKIKARILPPPLLNRAPVPKEQLIHWGVLNLAKKLLNNQNLIDEFMTEVVQ